jgi:hypothetical protein
LYGIVLISVHNCVLFIFVQQLCRPTETMQNDAMFYMVLFCALMLVNEHFRSSILVKFSAVCKQSPMTPNATVESVMWNIWGTDFLLTIKIYCSTYFLIIVSLLHIKMIIIICFYNDKLCSPCNAIYVCCVITSSV